MRVDMVADGDIACRVTDGHAVFDHVFTGGDRPDRILMAVVTHFDIVRRMNDHCDFLLKFKTP